MLGRYSLNLKELQLGTWNFALRVENYEPVALLLDATPNETSNFRTDLTSQSYNLPDNAHALRLVADLKQREPEQLEKMRVEQLERSKKAFDSAISQTAGARAFQYHELKTDKPVGEVKSAIIKEFQLAQPPFQVAIAIQVSRDELFKLEASQSFSGGSRRCVIGGGQSTDQETRIFFSVLEFKKISFMKQPITSLVGVTPLEYAIIDPEQLLSEKIKIQIAEGISNVTVPIQSAIGQATQSSFSSAR